VRLLLDTHVAVWSVAASDRLPAHIVDMIGDPENEVFVSIVSLWEIALKNAASSRSSRDPMPFTSAVAAFRFDEFGYASLDLRPPHILRFENARAFNRDPFDRLLVSQAAVEGQQLVTHDAALKAYGPHIISF
jgi:PIN domain nuclease of toxin-antitoxin system